MFEFVDRGNAQAPYYKCEKVLYLLEKYTIISNMRFVEQIRHFVENLPPGEPFMPKALLEIAPRSAIDMTLSRFVQQGKLRRAGRGLYARPEKSEWTGEHVPVELEAALNTITQHLGETIAPHGAIAVNRFNLSTQIPMRPIFLTTGRSRVLEIEGREVELKHVNPRQLPLGASRPGVALIAMRYLGHEHLEPHHVQQIREQLSTDEWAQLKTALIGQPAWLIEAIQRNEGQYV